MYFDTLWIFVLGKTHFHSIYYNFQTNSFIIQLSFSGEADSLCEPFEPSHTFYWLTVHAVTSSIFVIPFPVESRDRGGNDEPKNCWYLQNEKS